MGIDAAENPVAAAAAAVIGDLRAALAGVLLTFPEVRRAADLKRRLGLDVALAWQVFSLAHSSEPLVADRILPKSGAMKRFFKACARAGVAGERLVRAERAYAAFESFVEQHAGDRGAFSALIAGLAPADPASWKKLRRAAFRANAAVWGVSVECAVNCAVYHQRAGGEIDALSLRGRLGVHGLRPGAALATSISTRAWGAGQPPPDHAGPGAPAERILVSGGGLLTHACSQPLPAIQTRTAPDGTPRDYAVLKGLGRRHAAALWWATLSAALPHGSPKPPHGCSCPTAEPTELLLVDMLVPRGWSDPARRRLRVVGPDVHHAPGGTTGLLPCDAEALYLGQHLEALATPRAPQYADLLARELTALGWLDTPFDVYRCSMPYPVLHSVTHLYID